MTQVFFLSGPQTLMAHLDFLETSWFEPVLLVLPQRRTPHTTLSIFSMFKAHLLAAIEAAKISHVEEDCISYYTFAKALADRVTDQQLAKHQFATNEKQKQHYVGLGRHL